MAGITDDDLRAAVAAGILSEAQAARTVTLAQARAGTRAMLSGDDEPFELFRGFAEIFISVGLVLLLAGFLGIASLTASPIVVAVAGLAISWPMALYFTRKRRMALPSILLVVAYGLALAGLIVSVLDQFWPALEESVPVVLGVGSAIIAGLLLHYAVFRVPFTMFLIGLTGLAMILYLTTTLRPGADWTDVVDLFDLRQGSGLAIGTLVFGLIAFLAGMIFDLKDPHRLGRMAASGFWLHLLAAPALVNTVALTFWNMNTTTGQFLLAAALALITILALVIDRRSFLTAAIGYMVLLLGLVLNVEGGFLNWAWLLIMIGAFVTLIGAFWHQARGAVLRALPNFPGKESLPPYV